MTANTTTAEDRLARLGIQLPDAPTPFGAYVPAVQTGNLLFLRKSCMKWSPPRKYDVAIDDSGYLEAA